MQFVRCFPPVVEYPAQKATTMRPTAVERQAALRGRLYMAQNACATSLREVDALERQLLRLSVERATADELLTSRCSAIGW